MNSMGIPWMMPCTYIRGKEWMRDDPWTKSKLHREVGLESNALTIEQVVRVFQARMFQAEGILTSVKAQR